MDSTQHALANWVPPDVLVGAVVALLGVIWFTWRNEQRKQTAVVERLAGAVSELNLRLMGVVSVADFRTTVGGLHDKINLLQQRVAVLEDRAAR